MVTGIADESRAESKKAKNMALNATVDKIKELMRRAGITDENELDEASKIYEEGKQFLDTHYWKPDLTSPKY